MIPLISLQSKKTSRPIQDVSVDLTDNFQFQAKGALSSLVACDTCIRPRIILCQGVDDQGVDAVLTHQHLVVNVWVDGPPIDQPHQLRVGETTHLEMRQKLSTLLLHE